MVARVGSVSEHALHEDPTLAKSVPFETATVVVSWPPLLLVRRLAIFVTFRADVSASLYGVAYTPFVVPTKTVHETRSNVTPAASPSGIVAKTTGAPAAPAFSAFGTR